MKRIALLSLCLLMVFCLLAGCDDGYPEGNTLKFTDLQLTLPGDFINLSKEGIAADADFIYGRKTLIVTGAAEDKTKLQTMTLEQYTSLVISGNKLETTPEACGKGYTFTYQRGTGDGEYTYITATFEGKNNFWLFQFYCPTKDLETNRPEIDMILSSIRPDNN